MGQSVCLHGRAPRVSWVGVGMGKVRGRHDVPGREDAWASGGPAGSLAEPSLALDEANG